MAVKFFNELLDVVPSSHQSPSAKQPLLLFPSYFQFVIVHQIPTAFKSLTLWMVTFTLWIVASQKSEGLQTDWIISQQLP